MNLAVRQVLSMELIRRTQIAALISPIGIREMAKMIIASKTTKKSITSSKKISKSLRKVYRANVLVVQQQTQ